MMTSSTAKQGFVRKSANSFRFHRLGSLGDKDLSVLQNFTETIPLEFVERFSVRKIALELNRVSFCSHFTGLRTYYLPFNPHHNDQNLVESK